jgi:hypothetical protein
MLRGVGAAQIQASLSRKTASLGALVANSYLRRYVTSLSNPL